MGEGILMAVVSIPFPHFHILIGMAFLAVLGCSAQKNDINVDPSFVPFILVPSPSFVDYFSVSPSFISVFFAHTACLVTDCWMNELLLLLIDRSTHNRNKMGRWRSLPMHDLLCLSSISADLLDASWFRTLWDIKRERKTSKEKDKMLSIGMLESI